MKIGLIYFSTNVLDRRKSQNDQGPIDLKSTPFDLKYKLLQKKLHFLLNSY